MCLAWSEETMSPETDASARFIEAMRGSHVGHGLSVQWDVAEVQERILHAAHYLQLHDWSLDDDDDDDSGEDLERGNMEPDHMLMEDMTGSMITNYGRGRANVADDRRVGPMEASSRV